MGFETKIRLSDDKVVQYNNVSLTLSGDTKIHQEGTIEYTTCRHGEYVDRSLVDKEYVDDQISGVTGITTAALTGATNGLNIDTDPRIVELGGTLIKNTTISGDGGTYDLSFTDLNSFNLSFDNTSVITDLGSNSGILYGGDYSANYVARSLVDADYVTGLTSGINEDIGELSAITTVAITGVTNGLTKVGSHDAILGGTLTGNTTFTGTGSNYHLLYAADYSSQFSALSIPHIGYVTGITSGITEDIGELSAITTVAITGVTNGLTKIGNHDAVLGGTLTGNTIFTGTASNYHLQYAADYGDAFTARSIPDVDYLTGITSAIEEVSNFALTGATNGLNNTANPRVVELGGGLTKDTFVTGSSGTECLSFDNLAGFRATTCVSGGIICADLDGVRLETQCNWANGGPMIELFRDGIGAGNNSIYASSYICSTFRGIRYCHDGYHANYTLRSLPDVDYVTGITSQIESDITGITEITNVAITGVSNGLTKCGNHNAVLGGTLTEPTTISGSQIFGINVNQINLTGTTSSCGINLGGTVSLKTAPSGTGGLLCINDISGEIQQTSLAAFGGITGATNGLTDCGNQEIGLGGILCSNTTISGANFNLSLGDTASKLGEFNVCAANTKIGTGTFNVCSSGMTFTDLSATQQGIKYNADYSTTYVDRSLVDKGYVDAVATGLQPHEAVKAVTTGQTTLSGEQTVDGIALVAGDRVLVKNQSTASQNGIYVVDAGAWTRATDFNDDPTGFEVKSGDIVPVLSGDTQAATIWILTTPDPITVGTTDLIFTLFSRSLNYIGGDGISITQGTGLNQTIAVDLVTNSALCFNATQLSVASTIAGIGLSWSGGTINANAISDGVAGISVRVDGSDNLVVNAADINTALGGVLSGSTNGLTDANGVVCLGGTLTTATTLIGTDTNSFTYQDNAVTNKRGILYAGDYSATYVARSLVDAGFVTGLTSNITTNLNTFTGETRPIIDAAITGVTNGLTKIGNHNAVLGGTLTGNTVFTGTASNFHLQYAADYSSAFSARSIPDVNFVTGQTSTAGIQTANNGLTKLGTNVVWGGDLTGDTYIDGNGTVGILTINDINSITISTTGAVNDIGGFFNVDTTGILIEATNNLTTGTILDMGVDNTFVISTYNSGTFVGAVYGGDYENNFVPRSLVTKQYVTGITSGIQEDIIEISGVTVNAITGATNGLTKVGRNATLGGDLTGNTVINGMGTHSLGLGASGSLLTALNVHATSTNLNSTLNVTGNTIIGGTLTLNTVSTGTASDNVLLIDSSNLVKQIPASEFGNITGATNGTCVNGRNVVLGGALTGNTEISGASYSFTMGNLCQLSLAVTNGGSYSLSQALGALITSTNSNNISLSSANEINATAISNINFCAGNNSNIKLDATAGTTGNVELLADTNILITAPTTNIISTNFNVTGTTTLNTVASGNSTQDSVLVRTSAGEVRQVPATSLGEDNNNYFITIISGNTTLNETQYVILVDSNTLEITITLPASPIDGQAYKIKDYTGNALTNNIIINGNGNPIDDGGATINTDYGALEIVYSGVLDKWYVMSFVN